MKDDPNHRNPAPDRQDPTSFPSGAWHGYYTYGSNGAQHFQRLYLTFREGRMSGSGVDDIGRFVIRGSYDIENRDGDVWWSKTYLRQHDVFCRGRRRGEGIGGLWQLKDGTRGRFLIWPLGLGGVEFEEAGEEQPLEVILE